MVSVVADGGDSKRALALKRLLDSEAVRLTGGVVDLLAVVVKLGVANPIP